MIFFPLEQKRMLHSAVSSHKSYTTFTWQEIHIKAIWGRCNYVALLLKAQESYVYFIDHLTSRSQNSFLHY